jgi:hypothetical protein
LIDSLNLIIQQDYCCDCENGLGCGVPALKAATSFASADKRAASSAASRVPSATEEAAPADINEKRSQVELIA